MADAVLRAACVQITSQREIAPNLAQLDRMIREAITQGAQLIATPEVSDLLEPKNALLREKAHFEKDHPTLAHLRDLAAQFSVWILIGSLVIKRETSDGAPFANRSYLIQADGAIAASYDKIHMFDVAIEDGQTYHESRHYEAGQKAVLAQTPWGGLGMTICYDVRFPYLHRHLAQQGAQLITVPAAFTRLTGQAHWHILLRARAIETGCFILAPAQCGTHAEGRETFGHSLILSPWGDILGEGGTEPGLIVADLDLAHVTKARTHIPSFAKDRPFDAALSS